MLVFHPEFSNSDLNVQLEGAFLLLRTQCKCPLFSRFYYNSRQDELIVKTVVYSSVYSRGTVLISKKSHGTRIPLSTEI